MNKKSILKKPKNAQSTQEKQLITWSKSLIDEARSRLQYDFFALEWIEKLVDPVSLETLEEARKYLRKSDYDQVVKERKLVNLCGYPVCPYEPKQQTRYKLEDSGMKVYGGLNYYCSKDCFLKSCQYMVELSDEPLWIREDAREAMKQHLDPRQDEAFRKELENKKIEDVRLLLQALPVGYKAKVGEIVEHPLANEQS
ncbi:putative RNA polymerase II subunit B1 CTD phosphatase rtr1 [Schizosaccharomyces pombe]|uniref:Putative RNA polymerase II subunit B1 CTD phosphatase rtr1 n=1 Tax=Schizosaccharomyces pombe (strain 972 / ATCC 24843) TaxID=284812 RepID=RPAP2_SCHPO|nr:putative RNA polymerase II CTD phosphatase Rtr1 [Schizosaccharomyces pombe]O42853.1 RecName: Full=Putative RNA polymerase II subunit B1 CTD phosphatase rtr1; AltName: Full=RNA polymerase II-associated protein 2 homolog rtr1 [Schizosaccharomyces pombe 972h-]CAA16990.1 RNA polymerase II CTD phosphatase Rtr1 (predicted) [Schizosaccharomyces pombe]|eukprot:NP_594445.1 putative RNA polymerase II CTD phosphatase Rtr1 [Schizosaccharomyces pombe]